LPILDVLCAPGAEPAKSRYVGIKKGTENPERWSPRTYPR